MSFDTQVEKFSYALGLSMASNLLQSQIKTVELQSMFDAIADVMEGRAPKISPQDANKVIEEYFVLQQQRIGSINQKEGEDFYKRTNKTKELLNLKVAYSTK